MMLRADRHIIVVGVWVCLALIGFGSSARANVQVAAVPPTWSQTRIDPAPNGLHPLTQYPSAASDAQGGWHVAYMSSTDSIIGNLRYASSGPTGWVTDTVAPGGAFASLALDDADRPHIAHLQIDAGGTLWSTERTGASWQTQTITTGLNVAGSGFDLDLALEPSGSPRVAYTYYSAARPQYSLGYAEEQGANWVFQPFDAATARDVNLALDQDVHAQLAFWDPDQHQVTVASANATAWDAATVGPADSPGYFQIGLDLASDASDELHLAYSDEMSGQLIYATRSGSAWVTETVAAANTFAFDLVLRLDDAGRPHLAYRPVSDSLPRHAVRSATGWVIEVASETPARSRLGLAVDGLNRVAVFYTEAATGALWVATRQADQVYLAALHRP